MTSTSRRIAILSSTLILGTLALGTLSACGGSDAPAESDIVTPTYQKNAALPQSTAPRTVTTPMPQTTAPKTVTTPMPKLGSPKTTMSPRPSVTYRA